MILFNSKEKDRNYHRSKKKFFQHNPPRSKEKPIAYEQTNNISTNLNPRSKSPQKQEKDKRSPSKQSKKSKGSGFSDKDKLMTKQMVFNAVQYGGNTLGQRQRIKPFRSPDLKVRQNQKINDKQRQRRSVQAKLIKRCSRQHQKDQPIKRKQKFIKLFQKTAALNQNQNTRTPPKSPKHDFLQQKGLINPQNIAPQQVEQLQQLRQQNQFYKLIYKASLQKMKRLQTNIQKQKQDYKKTKQHFQKQLKDLKYKVLRADKKVSIGHLYSYDQKQILKVEPDKIITQTDNQASEITHQNDKSKRKQDMPSRLSIEST